jgi:signal transduction histidine kinase
LTFPTTTLSKLSGQFVDATLEKQYLSASEARFRRRDRFIVMLIFLLELVLIATDLRVFADKPEVGVMRLGVRALYMASLLVIILWIFKPSRGTLSRGEHVFLLFSMLLHNGIIASYHHPVIAAQLTQGFQLAVYVFTITAYYTFLSPRFAGILLVALCLAGQYILFTLNAAPFDTSMVYAPFLLFSLIAFSHYTAVTLAREHRKVWLGQEQARRRQLHAEETQQFRTRLLELVGHDLHQPLGALRYCLTALRYEAADLAPHPGERIGKIAGQIDQINQQVGIMLDKTLELAQIDNDAVQARCRWQSVAPLAGELRERFAASVEGAGIVLHIHGGGRSLRHDPALMSAVLRNLVGNALAHHARRSPRPRVLVAFRSCAGGCIDICDNGGGFPVAVLQPERSPQNRRRDHHGLGLTIARQLARKQGWALEIINAPGRGAHIRLSSRGSREQAENAAPTGRIATSTATHGISTA